MYRLKGTLQYHLTSVLKILGFVQDIAQFSLYDQIYKTVLGQTGTHKYVKSVSASLWQTAKQKKKKSAMCNVNKILHRVCN